MGSLEKLTSSLGGDGVHVLGAEIGDRRYTEKVKTCSVASLILKDDSFGVSFHGVGNFTFGDGSKKSTLDGLQNIFNRAVSIPPIIKLTQFTPSFRLDHNGLQTVLVLLNQLKNNPMSTK